MNVALPDREVNPAKRVQPDKGLGYCRVAISANGRIKPDVVLVDGKSEHHTEGAYYLEWREELKRVQLSVGKDAATAAAQASRASRLRQRHSITRFVRKRISISMPKCDRNKAR